MFGMREKAVSEPDPMIITLIQKPSGSWLWAVACAATGVTKSGSSQNILQAATDADSARMGMLPPKPEPKTNGQKLYEFHHGNGERNSSLRTWSELSESYRKEWEIQAEMFLASLNQQ